MLSECGLQSSAQLLTTSHWGCSLPANSFLHTISLELSTDLPEYSPQFHNLGTIDIWGWTILCFGDAVLSCALQGKFNSILASTHWVPVASPRCDNKE